MIEEERRGKNNKAGSFYNYLASVSSTTPSSASFLFVYFYYDRIQTGLPL
jgi:hypothetical protein